MRKLKSRIITRLTDERLEERVWTANHKLNLILKDYSSKSSIKYHCNDRFLLEKITE